MTIQAQNQLDSLLSELTNLPHGKVLSEFALARYLNQADKLLKIDAANAWHVKAVAYYYANDINNMTYSFDAALSLAPNTPIILDNYAACVINQGNVELIFSIFEKYSSYYIQKNEVVLKFNRLALNRFNQEIINSILEKIKQHPNTEEQEILESHINHDRGIVQKNLESIDLTWEQAKAISDIAFSIIFKHKVRTNSLPRMRKQDGELTNIIPIYTDLETIFLLNDELFNEIFEQNLLEIWNKFMCMFIVASEKSLTLEEV